MKLMKKSTYIVYWPVVMVVFITVIIATVLWLQTTREKFSTPPPDLIKNISTMLSRDLPQGYTLTLADYSSPTSQRPVISIINNCVRITNPGDKNSSGLAFIISNEKIFQGK